MAAATPSAASAERLSRWTFLFLPPELQPVSRRAFRFHMAYTLLDAVFAGIMGNAPVMAVKAMQASDAQLQLPIAMASVGFFVAVFAGAFMDGRRKKPFVVAPGTAMALSALLMACTHSAGWFLALAGLTSIFDFSVRPAIPSIVRNIYPAHCRSHVSGTLRQYAAVVFMASNLLFAILLASGGADVWPMIRLQLSLAGLLSLCSFACFAQLPQHGDGSSDEPALPFVHQFRNWREAPVFVPLRDPRFRLYLTAFFVFAFANLLYSGIVPAVFSRDLGYGYVGATLLIHIVPAIAAFLGGGRFTSWFDRTSVWKAYAVVALLWAIDPLVLAICPGLLPVVIAARFLRGPATVGSFVLCYYTGVNAFARGGRDTSCHTAALFLVNGVARLIAPTTAALLSGPNSHGPILLWGGLGVLAASGLFLAFERKGIGDREGLS